MRWSSVLLAAVAACGAPAAAHPTPSAPAPPPPTLTPALTPAPAPALTPAPAPAPAPSCALKDVTLPAPLAPCSPPDAKEYDTESDLVVDVERFPSTLHRGAAVELTVTLKNATRAPLKLRLSDPPMLTFEVSREGDPNAGPTEVIEPLPPSAVSLPVSCAHVSSDPPFITGVQPTPPPTFLTLAPGGIARARATWQPRRWVVPSPAVHGCDVTRRVPVAAGPLGPGGYIVQLRPPLDAAYEGNPGVPRARADIDILP